MKLTSKERVNFAMNLNKPDRVPLMCQFSIGSMLQQLKPDPVEFWYNKTVFAEGLVELCKRFKFDGILISLHGHSENWRKELVSQELLDDGKQKLIFNDRTEIHSLNDLPLVTIHKRKRTLDIEEIVSEVDIPSVIDYIPVSNNLYFKLDTDNLFEIFDSVYQKVGEEYSIHGEITSPFDYFLDLLGYQNGLISLIMSPEKSKSVLEKFTNGIYLPSSHKG